MQRTQQGSRWRFREEGAGRTRSRGWRPRLPPPADTSDVEVAPALLHGAGGEARRRGLPGRRLPGRRRREENRDADVQWRVALRPGRRQLDRSGPEAAAGKRKASGWGAEVEHPFPYGKRHFGYAQVRCRGLARNTLRTALLPGFAKVLIAG